MCLPDLTSPWSRRCCWGCGRENEFCCESLDYLDVWKGMWFSCREMPFAIVVVTSAILWWPGNTELAEQRNFQIEQVILSCLLLKHLCVYICTYIYTEREREKERHTLFLVVLGFWTQGFFFSFFIWTLGFLTLARQVLYHLSHSTSPFFVMGFSR
jgi:hypothetical protein